MTRRAVITGASSGIGAELARELSRRGWAVALLARRGDLLRDLAATLPRAVAIECDVSDASGIAAAVQRGEDLLGGPWDLAIANAGISVPTWATRFSIDDAVRMMNINVLGTFHLFAAVIPGMIERRQGQFAGIASIAGLRGLPSSSVYSASKAAMQAFLEASRVELRDCGVGVTIVNPGWVDTPMIAKHKGKVPFLVSAPKAARIIVDGLERRARVIQFPFPVSLAGRVIRLLPDVLFDLLIRPFAKRKYDQSKVRR